MINKETLKIFGSCAVSSIAAAFTAAYLTKKDLDKYYREQIEGLKDRYKTSMYEILDLRDKVRVYEEAGLSYETALAIVERNNKKIQDIDQEITESIENDKVVVEYSKAVSSEEETEEDEDSDGPEVQDLTPTTRVESEDPYMISVDEFSDSHEEYRKVSCTYYTEDNVLCETAHNEKIDICHAGIENIRILRAHDIDVIYVRNDYLGIDYEIDKYEGSYAYEVLGEESMDD